MASIRKRKWTSKGTEQVAWVVDYKDQSGKRRLKTFKAKKEAEAWTRTALYEVDRGTHTPDSTSVTVADAAEVWIKRAEREDLEQSTIRQYRQHVDYHINPLVGDVKLSRLTTPGVQKFKDDLLDTRSRALAQKALTSLKAILMEAQRRGLVSQNVAAGITIRRPSRHKKRIQIPTHKEVNALIQAAGDRWRPLFVTAVFTGLRASELRGLAWDDVDFEACVIHVRQRADRYCQLGSPKSKAGIRDVAFGPIVLNTLKEWKLACPPGHRNLVFPNGAGGVENLSNIYTRGLAPAESEAGLVDKAGKPRFGMHALRHFYASWLIHQGFRPKRVQTLLGHASIQMTYDVYGHLFPNEEDDFKRLEAAEIAVVGS